MRYFPRFLIKKQLIFLSFSLLDPAMICRTCVDPPFLISKPQELDVRKTCLQFERSALAENEEQGIPEEGTADALSATKSEDLETNEEGTPPQALPAMVTAHKVQWILFNIAANNAIIATLGY